jgi:hypothetical protein
MSVDQHLGKIYGNVKLTARLGQGAMGAVYRGVHLHFSRDVAVKVLLSGDGKGHSRERFVREGQAAAKIKHENVVQILDAGDAQGVIYLVMELVEGFSLGKILDDAGRLPPEAVTRLGVGISQGLAAIHAKGIIHRDIKPDNILVGHDRTPKITDLGLAKQTDDPEINRLTATGMVVGTPLYVAPENISDPKSATSAADIYSLGATLYHLLTGRPPFVEKTPYEVMRAHLESRVQPIRELAPGVPAGLAQLVERCLHKTPEKRPTAKELADSLSQGARLKASPLGGMALMIALTVVSVCAVAAIGWFALSAERRHHDAPPDEARLVLRVDHPDTRVLIDQAQTPAAVGAPLALSAGEHHLEVQSSAPGALWMWEGDVVLAPGQRLELPVTLATVGVPMQLIPVPGEGMLFCDGTAFGLDRTYPVTKAGTYDLARWDGKAWQSERVRLDVHGQLAIEPATVLAHPAGDAFWRHADDSGMALETHHVVSWWEAEQARDRGNLPPPSDWLIQGQRREQPALSLTPAMISAVHELSGGRLPDREAARRLSTAYQSSVWCETQGRLDFVGGGGPRSSLLILIPSEPERHH